MLKPKVYAKKSIFIFSGALALLLLTTLIVIGILQNSSPKPTTTSSTQSRPLNTEAYQTEAKMTVVDYESYLAGRDSIEMISKRKEHLLSLKISREWKSLHLDLVLIADSLQALSEGQTQEKDHVNQLLAELYNTYPWLRN